MISHDILERLYLNIVLTTCIRLSAKKKQATPATTTRSTADSDQELDEIRFVDDERVCSDCSTGSNNVSEDDDSESIATDGDTDTSSSESSRSEGGESIPSQREKQGEEYQEQQELKNKDISVTEKNR